MKKLFILSAFIAFISACHSTSVQNMQQTKLSDNNIYVDDFTRYRQNISLKTQGENFVTYEYKDVRVDELAPLAIKYCQNINSGLQAYLREIILYRNNLRRATFDCVNLAINE